MSKCCTWLGRSTCCRRHSQHAYIYLYSPNMGGSSSSHWCLICLLFIFCLAFMAVLATVVIYHLHSSHLIATQEPYIDPRAFAIAQKRQLPDFVNMKIDPCKNFYGFVCEKLTERKSRERISIDEEYQLKWRRIQREFHEKLMSKNSTSSFPNKNNAITSFYQLCENQSPELLLDELERFFATFSRQEPYRSYLTLFNQTKSPSIPPISLISLYPNPFFKIEYLSSNSSRILRTWSRPLPTPLAIFLNHTILNQTALKHLIQFDHDYRRLLANEKSLIQSYEQEYNQDSLIVKRILTYPNYHQCLSSLNSNLTNGLEKLINLIHHFVSSRLNNFNKNSIDKQIRMLDHISDSHKLVEKLQVIQFDLKTIDETVYMNNNRTKKYSCLIHLLDQLLDKKIQSNELISLMNFSTIDLIPSRTFLSKDWPFLVMLNDRLLKKTPFHTIINYVFFDYYRQFIYPYYQPHLQHDRPLIDIDQSKESSAFTYQTTYPYLSCHIQSCFDIFNCYHPSLLNQLFDHPNQSSIDDAKFVVENLFNRFRLLTEQSDNLYSNEKQQILSQLNQINLRFGHYSSISNQFPIRNFSSYIEYVQYYSSIPYDTEQRSYFIEPIYYPLNQTLFLPYGFLSLRNSSIEYHLIKLLLKILRSNLTTTPFYIDCLLKSLDEEYDYSNQTKFISNDEHLTYLLLRTKFLHEQTIVLDEYLWPFMSANSQMKHFLIDYTVRNYCSNVNGFEIYENNTFFNDDIYLIFHCQQASSIKQSKCTVI